MLKDLHCFRKQIQHQHIILFLHPLHLIIMQLGLCIIMYWAIPDNIRTPPIEEIGFPDFFR